MHLGCVRLVRNRELRSVGPAFIEDEGPGRGARQAARNRVDARPRDVGRLHCVYPIIGATESSRVWGAHSLTGKITLKRVIRGSCGGTHEKQMQRGDHGRN